MSILSSITYAAMARFTIKIDGSVSDVFFHRDMFDTSVEE